MTNIQSLRALREECRKLKRSKRIVLVLSGALGASLVGCNDRYATDRMVISSGTSYTNNHYVRGAGYYHAPYGRWYPHPHNTYEPGRGYYHGGQWTAQPNTSFVTASPPTDDAVTQAQNAHDTATRRGGFGGSRRSSSS